MSADAPAMSSCKFSMFVERFSTSKGPSTASIVAPFGDFGMPLPAWMGAPSTTFTCVFGFVPTMLT